MTVFLCTKPSCCEMTPGVYQSFSRERAKDLEEELERTVRSYQSQVRPFPWLSGLFLGRGCCGCVASDRMAGWKEGAMVVQNQLQLDLRHRVQARGGRGS